MSYTTSLTGRERSRWPPLTRMLMSGEMSEEKGRQLTRKERFDVWMVNEGYRRLFVFTFAILHVMVFVFGMMNYGLKVSVGELAQRHQLTSTGQFDRHTCKVWHNVPYRSCSSPNTTRRCRLHSIPSVQESHFDGSSHTTERHHSLRQEHHIPQACRLGHRFLLLGPHHCPLE